MRARLGIVRARHRPRGSGSVIFTPAPRLSRAGTGNPHIGGAPRVGLAKGFATAIAAGTADGLVHDLDLDLAALDTHEPPVAPALMLASVTSADDVLAAALAPAPGGAARITSPTLGIHPPPTFEYGVSAALSRVDQCRAAMPPMPRVEAGAATPLVACIRWISL